jgi:hypothetical protein
MNHIRHGNGTMRPQYELMRGWGRKGTTYNECLQIHPDITKQKPDITCDSKYTCSAADGHRGTTSIGVDPKDSGI